jgi:predicted SAM-dependent methyltransferase
VSATPQAFDPALHPRKLNLGCGLDLREGYVNVDLNSWHHPDVLADVRDLAFLPALHYDEVLAQDVLEHLPRSETARILAHWNRPLRLGGTIVLRVPSVLAIADLMRRAENQSAARQEELLKFLFGTQAYTGDFHYTSFTPLLLRAYLEAAGFAVRSIDVAHEWVLDVVAEKARHIEGPPVRDLRRELLDMPADGEFLRRCFREILGREPDSSGWSYFLGMNRREVVDTILGSEEFAARQPA